MSQRLIRIFSRITSGARVLLEVDGLRCVAIMGVLIYHLNAQMWSECGADLKSDKVSYWINYTCSRGNFGVPLFFAISAFILSLPLFRFYRSDGESGTKKSFGYGAYLMRRLLRIEPPYVICMLVMFAAYVVLDSKDVLSMGKHLLASLFYVHNIVYDQPSKVNGVAWSLEVEVQFYLLAPAMIYLISRFQPGRRRISVVLATLALCLPTTFVVGFSILTTLHFFSVGILMADIYCIHWKESPSLHRRHDLLTLIAMPLALLSPGDHAVGTSACVAKLAWVGAIAALFWGALRGTVTHWILTRWPVYLVGGMCYTIYLWHSAYWRRLWRWLTDRSVDTYYPLYFLMWGGIFLVVIMISCAFLFLVFEKPFMRRDWPKAMVSHFRKATCRLKGG